MAGAASECLEDVLDRSRAWEVALPALKDAGFLRRDYQRPSVDEEVKALQQMMLQEHPPREEAEPAVPISKRKGDDAEQFSGLRENPSFYNGSVLNDPSFFQGPSHKRKCLSPRQWWSARVTSCSTVHAE